MKKIVLLIIIMISLWACSLINTPSSVVENYLDKYTSLSEDVITDMESTIINENLSEENREIYKNVLLRTYQNLKYEIKDETIDGEKAEVIVKITIYNLDKIKTEADNYINEHIDEFTDVNHNFNEELYDSYRLNAMLNTSEIVSYDVKFKLTKIDNEWTLNNPDRETLEKIHGLYHNM